MELVYRNPATEPRCALTGVSADGNGTRLLVAQPCFWNLVHRPWQPLGATPPNFVENVPEHLADPGCFYVDHAKREVR